VCFSAGLRPACAVLFILTASCGAHKSTVPERLAILPFENLTADPKIDWLANASAAALVSNLTGLRQIYAFRADSIRTAYATHAARVLEANFEFIGDRLGLHASLEDLTRHRIVRQFSLSGPLREGIIPLVNQLAKELDPGARAFSTRDPAAFGSFGQALSASDASGQARLLQTASIQDPNFTAAYTDLGQTLLKLGDRADAEKVVASGAQHAANPIDRAQLAYLSAVARNDPGAREKALANLAQLTPADPEVFRNLAQTHLLQHKYADAVRDYQTAARLDPDEPATFNSLGYAQAYAHDLAGARRSLGVYQTLSVKGDVNPIDSLGEVSFYLGDFGAAERYFLEAHQLDSGARAGVELLKAAQARLMTGDRNGADKIFERYIFEPHSGQYRNAQDRAQTEYQRAQWEFLTGRRKQALGRIEGLLPSASGDTAALLDSQLSIWNLQTGNRTAATSLALDASKKATAPAVQSLSALCRFLSAPAVGHSNNNLADALALLFLGRFAEAIPPLEALYRDTPPESNAQVRTLLAWAYTKTGRTRDASELVDLYPIPLSGGESVFASMTFPRFLQVRSTVLDSQGKRDEAQKVMKLFQEYAGDLPDKTAP
jgi:tetratricopeptide (TPR) repeat protein